LEVTDIRFIVISTLKQNDYVKELLTILAAQDLKIARRHSYFPAQISCNFRHVYFILEGSRCHWTWVQRGAVRLEATCQPTLVAYDCCDMALFMEMSLVEFLTSNFTFLFMTGR
jgi:hypothetical protein